MMNTAADHLYTLHRNAFALAPVIQSFYLNWEPMEKDILLSYLVLPLVSFPRCRVFAYRQSNQFDPDHDIRLFPFGRLGASHLRNISPSPTRRW